MTKDKLPVKSYETSSSHAVVLAASLLIACLMPVVRSIAYGDHDVAVFASAHAPVATSSTIPRGGAADEVSMLAVGVFLLGLGSVMRRVA